MYIKNIYKSYIDYIYPELKIKYCRFDLRKRSRAVLKAAAKEYEKALKERKKVLRELCGAVQRRTTWGPEMTLRPRLKMPFSRAL